MINDIILASFLLTLNRFYQCSKDRQRLYWTAPEFRLPQICILFSGCLKFGLLRTSSNATAEKVSVYGVFLVLIFPHSKLNTEIYSVNLRIIQSKCEKIRIRKPPNMDTFYVVWPWLNTSRSERKPLLTFLVFTFQKWFKIIKYGIQFCIGCLSRMNSPDGPIYDKN